MCVCVRLQKSGYVLIQSNCMAVAQSNCAQQTVPLQHVMISTQYYITSGSVIHKTSYYTSVVYDAPPWSRRRAAHRRAFQPVYSQDSTCQLPCHTAGQAAPPATGRNDFVCTCRSVISATVQVHAKLRCNVNTQYSFMLHFGAMSINSTASLYTSVQCQYTVQLHATLRCNVNKQYSFTLHLCAMSIHSTASCYTSVQCQ